MSGFPSRAHLQSVLRLVLKAANSTNKFKHKSKGVFAVSLKGALRCGASAASVGFRKPFTNIVVKKGCRTFRGMSQFKCRNVQSTFKKKTLVSFGGTTWGFSTLQNQHEGPRNRVRHAFQIWEALKGGFKLGFCRCVSLEAWCRFA